MQLLWPLALAFGAYQLYEFIFMGKTTADKLPGDTNARRAAVRAAIGRARLGSHLEAADKAHAGAVRRAFFNQAQLETGDFFSDALKRTNSLTNRHVGRGLGSWLQQTYVTPSGEPLRVYASLEQSIEDLAQHLLEDPLYAAAKAALLRGDIRGYNAAVTNGNGKNGYVGDPKAAKATNYIAALNNILDREGRV